VVRPLLDIASMRHEIAVRAFHILTLDVDFALVASSMISIEQ
jgi:hypothetical protein